MRKRICFLTLAVLAAALVAQSASAFAASASLSVSASKTSVKPGDSVSVTFTYTGATFGAHTTEIKYDASILRFDRCDGAMAGGGAGIVTTTGMDGSGVSSLSATLRFTALKAGSSTVTVTSTDCVDLEGIPLTRPSARSVSISVQAPSTSSASGNANLSSLRVSAGTLSPAFSPNVTSYTVNVGNEVTTCTVSVTTASAKATVKVSGSAELAVGANVRKLTVTAENGTTKVYTITINRSSEPSGEEPSGDEKRPDELKAQVGDKEYVVCEDIDEQSIPEGFVMTTAKMGESEIPVIKDNELKYALVLLRDSETGDEKWFFYDEETDTFSETISVDAESMLRYEKALAALGDDEDVQEQGLSPSDKVLFLAFGTTAAALLAVVLVLQVKILRTRAGRK